MSSALPTFCTTEQGGKDNTTEVIDASSMIRSGRQATQAPLRASKKRRGFF
jgi:hypothetical protein